MGRRTADVRDTRCGLVAVANSAPSIYIGH
jgi:hypothetical protein